MRLTDRFSEFNKLDLEQLNQNFDLAYTRYVIDHVIDQQCFTIYKRNNASWWRHLL